MHLLQQVQSKWEMHYFGTLISEPVKVWDAQSTGPLQTFPIVPPKYDSGFSPDNSRHVVGTWEGSLMIWDVEAGKLLSENPREFSPRFWLTYSADGTQIFTGIFDGKISVWDTSIWIWTN